MRQFHTELPCFCNRMGQARKMKQHLQGLTVHGKRTRLYRTVDHIKNGANVCIYILLLALDEELQSSGSLRRTLHVQVDGGPENANYWFLTWMEILIAIEIGIEERFVECDPVILMRIKTRDSGSFGFMQEEKPS